MKKLLQMFNDPDSYFRAGVGIVVLNANDDLVVFERSDFPDNYQFSQGGLDAGEEPLVGALRELYEETGISEDQVVLLGELPHWVSYTASVHRPKSFDYRGQTQKWFYVRLNENVDIDLSSAQDKEFISYKWVTIEESLEYIIDFKKDMYTQILDYLTASILKK